MIQKAESEVKADSRGPGPARRPDEIPVRWTFFFSCFFL
jgi:hypothetical protein